ncbi:sigma-70 family RNA polymerase sigma factor [Sphingobium sp. KCTC 72723]|uniref:sigma-70 family RNA polymerase sigma factor n=1 Tax=Sphingobium sp. KCTC 72723 TaxID=2733867 RepID=UPI00165D4BBE|nr:sigma-70 family RNA polymerase sigma factor [Sphingobium sp. KCTC 72723]
MSEAATLEVRPTLTDREFKDRMKAILPHLRAFGRSLCGDRDLADDLVQETMLKAWSARHRFMADTNFRAWCFTILRNHYFSVCRRRKFVGAWDDLVADRLLATSADQDATVQLNDVMRAMSQLPVPQREALILVGAGGLAYEEAAQVMGVAIGTVKSRVARARAALEALMEGGILAHSRNDMAPTPDIVVNIMAYMRRIEAQAPGAEQRLAA